MTNGDLCDLAEQYGVIVTDELIALADELAQRIRSATIAECARLCDIREREYDTHTSQTNRGAAIGARYCAAAIRALDAK